MGQACTVSSADKGKRNAWFAETDKQGLNKVPVQDKYTSGKNMATKVSQVKHKTSNAIRVAYQLPKCNAPCLDTEEIIARLPLLRKLEHPNICQFVEAFDDPKYVILIYEQAEGRPILDQLAQEDFISEHKVAGIMRQVLIALKYGLEHDIPCHGALVPKNIFLNPAGDVKVTDYGLAGLVKQHPIDAIIGADVCQFLSTESVQPWLKKQPKYGTARVKLGDAERARCCTSASDVWAVGIILHLLLTGITPFQGANLRETAENVVKNEATRLSSDLTDGAREMLVTILQTDPKKRMSVYGLVQHAWLTEKVPLSNQPVCASVCSHLKSIHAETGFKKMMMRMIATKIPASKVPDLQKAFELMDCNRDGQVTLQELRDGLAKHPGLLGDSSADMESIFGEIDNNGSGTISLQEFFAATIDSQTDLVDKLLYDAFRAFDVDSSGSLTLDELHEVAHRLEGHLGDDHLEIITHCLEGEIEAPLTFDAFRNLVMSEGGRSTETHAAMKEGVPMCAKIRRKCACSQIDSRRGSTDGGVKAKKSITEKRTSDGGSEPVSPFATPVSPKSPKAPKSPKSENSPKSESATTASGRRSERNSTSPKARNSGRKSTGQKNKE